MTDDENVTVIRWRNINGCRNYAVQYILSRGYLGQHLFVSGDLGSAVFKMLSWDRETMTVKGWASTSVENHLSYLMGKLESASDRYQYDVTDAEHDLREYLIDDPEDYDEEELNDIEQAIEDAMDEYDYGSGFSGTKAYEIISEYDPDCWEWLGWCGRTYHTRCLLWLEGLVMACKQIQEGTCS